MFINLRTLSKYNKVFIQNIFVLQAPDKILTLKNRELNDYQYVRPITDMT